MVSNKMALLALPLLLAGCFAQTDISSTAEIEVTDNPNEFSQALVDSVVERAEDLGATCRQYDAAVSCQFLNRNRARFTSINAGTDRAGAIYFDVHTSLTTLLPVSETKLLSGGAIPQFHKEWEAWFVDQFGSVGTQTRTRRSPSHGVIGSF